MRAVIQRCLRADVRVSGEIRGHVERGFVILLGVSVDDTTEDARVMAEKVTNLRVFEDAGGLMNLSLRDVAGGVLLVSQFTLLGDARKGRRPSFIAAAREDVAKPLYERVGELLERETIPVEYGVFGADMEVELVNHGPVTILLDTKKTF
ncbi:MAG: D-aminoacyl-tRNA deacylase [Candidatus Eremiobacteraeota bacterium]|nr:D-aminoacyl-tRNA deacylase [Candidatus Eremiobacteraeota bacterium]